MGEINVNLAKSSSAAYDRQGFGFERSAGVLARSTGNVEPVAKKFNGSIVAARCGWDSRAPRNHGASRSRWGWWSRFQALKASSLVSAKRYCNVGDSTWPSQNATLALPATE
jgi:hypothetical protein